MEMENNSNEIDSSTENTVENTVLLESVNNKLDTIIGYHEHTYSLSLLLTGVFSVVLVCILIYKFIDKFVEF